MNVLVPYLQQLGR